MLIQKRNYVLLTGVLLIVMAVSCQPSVRTIPKVELSRSPEIQLNLKNETSGNLRILPAQDPAAGTPIVLFPGSVRKFKFHLVRIADLEETIHSWMRPVRGSETSMIITDEDSERFIDVQGEDGLIMMRNDQDRLWKLLLDVENCFEAQNVVNEIGITGPPDPILPTAVCE